MAHSSSLSKRLASGVLAGALVWIMAGPVWADCTRAPLAPVASEGVAAPLAATLTLDLGAAARQRIATQDALNAGTLNVRLNGVIVDGAQVTGFRVFLNDADAGIATSVQAPNYVSSFSFFPDAQPGVPAGSFVVDLQSTIFQLLAQGAAQEDALTLTLVPIGAGNARIGLQAGFELLE